MATYKGKSMRPGGGGRFAKMTDAMMMEGMSKDKAEAIAAAKGRAKYGKRRFQQMAEYGRKRAAKK